MKILFYLLFLVLSISVNAQIAINTDGSIPDNSAMLDVKSTTKGLLVPRMSSPQRLAILNPAEGLLLFDTSTGSYWYFNGTNWNDLAASAIPGWLLTGNSGIDTAINFIGTIDEQPLRFRVNNAWAGELHPTNGNVFLGIAAGHANTDGILNTSFGDHSLSSNTTGNRNTANGYYALYSNTSGNNNTSTGNLSLLSNSIGVSNTANGYAALYSNTSGNSNTAYGEISLFSNISGNNNVANGNYSLYSNTTGNNNTANGYAALVSNNTGSDNTANGYQALYANTVGYNNTANGFQALYSNTSGFVNAANGWRALYSNTTGSFNTANGEGALYSNISGNYNTANGSSALYSNTSGIENTATGISALDNNTSGWDNTANGAKALYSNTSGAYNTSLGSSALFYNTSGSYNIAIGYNSGPAPGFTNLSNTIGIGNDGGYQHGGSNQVVIGNASMLVIAGKVGWSVLSDARIKNTINEDVKGLDFILKLRPVTYHISNAAITAVTGSKETPDFPGKYDGEKVKYSGFIAQEVEHAAKAANYEFSGYDIPKNERGLYTIKYAEFVVPLVKGMQEQQQMIVELKQSNDDLNKTIEQLLIRVENLEAK